MTTEILARARHGWVALAAVALVGCEIGRPPVSGFPVHPIELRLMQEREGFLIVALHVEPDGRVVHDHQVVAQFRGPELLAPDGRVLFRVGADGAVTGARAEPGDRFDEDDHFHFGHYSIWLQNPPARYVKPNDPPLGTVNVALKDYDHPLVTKVFPAQFAGISPEAQREALVCFMLLLPRDKLVSTMFGPH